MARPLRIEYSGAVYHVVCRGNNRQNVFKAMKLWSRAFPANNHSGSAPKSLPDFDYICRELKAYKKFNLTLDLSCFPSLIRSPPLGRRSYPNG